MKKIILSVNLLILLMSQLFAQNQDDVLRYSQSFPFSTARSMSMGGAFGALGGDFSSLSINPAGLAVYRSNEFTITPQFSSVQTNANFLNTTTGDNRYTLDLNNIGLVLSYQLNKQDTGWANINFSFGYNKLANFDANIMMQGVNNSSSMLDYFVAKANGHTPDQLNYLAEGLAYNTYMLDTSGGLSKYNSVLSQWRPTASVYGQTQRKYISSNGSMGEYNFSVGTNFNHIVFIGASVNLVTVYYNETTIYTESDDKNVIPQFQQFTYKQELTTTGQGYNFKFGILVAPVDWLRIGGSVHTPTFFSLHDDYGSYMNSTFDTPDNNGVSSYRDSTLGQYDYQITTPFKANLSAAFIYKKSALLSVDYEYINYSKARINAGDNSFYVENTAIQTNLTTANNFRLGGEYRYGPFSLRAGFAYYGNPYTSSATYGNYDHLIYSGGLGIKINSVFLDFAYQHTTYSQIHYLYDVPTAVTADINTTNDRFLFTLGFKF